MAFAFMITKCINNPKTKNIVYIMWVTEFLGISEKDLLVNKPNES